MTEEEFQKASDIKKEINRLKSNLKPWENIRFHNLGYRDSSHDMVLFTNKDIPPEMFNIFRTGCVEVLKNKIINLEKQFEDVSCTS